MTLVLAGLLAGCVHVVSGPDHLAAIAPYAVEGKARAFASRSRPDAPAAPASHDHRHKSFAVSTFSSLVGRASGRPSASGAAIQAALVALCSAAAIVVGAFWLASN